MSVEKHISGLFVCPPVCLSVRITNVLGICVPLIEVLARYWQYTAYHTLPDVPHTQILYLVIPYHGRPYITAYAIPTMGPEGCAS